MQQKLPGCLANNVLCKLIYHTSYGIKGISKNMNVICKEEGLILIEQYNKKYIRFAAGEIAEMLYQVPITADEVEKIKTGEYSMASVVNSYSNKGKLSSDILMDNLIKDYLQCNTNYSKGRITNFITKLRKYNDIFLEFYYYVFKKNSKKVSR